MSEQLKSINSFSDQEVIFKEQTGKDFNTLYQKYYPKLVYFTSKICNDQQKAEDISTDSFLAAFEKIEKYEKEKSQFSTWLFTIAKNLALQDIKPTRKTMSLDVELDEEGTTLKDFIQEEESYLHLQELNDKKSEIMKCRISALKDPYKTVIEMRELKKMTYKNIACNQGRDVKFEINVQLQDKCPLPMELSKVYKIMDSFGNNIEEFNLIEGDTKKTPFFTEISINPGKYIVSARTPKSLSTIKSQIRNGRAILINETRKEFDVLDEMYL
jgi:RNA polymerase sigma-70 factor (ECF subfamily)